MNYLVDIYVWIYVRVQKRNFLHKRNERNKINLRSSERPLTSDEIKLKNAGILRMRRASFKLPSFIFIRFSVLRTLHIFN